MRNIAIIIPGGIGTGHNNIGVPVLERIIKLLSKDFRITVFQLYKANYGFRVEGFDLVNVYSTNPFLKCFRLFFVFYRMHRTKKFMIVHGFWALPSGVMAVLLGKIFNLKSVVSLLGGDAIALPEIKYGQLRNAWYRKVIFWGLGEADEINALTQYLVDNLKRAGFERQNFKIIPWGIDTDLFGFLDKETRSPVQFLHIANLHPVKDQETLLRAFKIIKEKTPSQLTIIGQGISDSVLIALVSELGLKDNVTMLGLLPYEKLPEIYHKADILLHTSLSEGQSEVVTEAMSCGVVVCGTNVGLLYDLPDCCVSVNVGDYQGLARETLTLLHNQKHLQKLKLNAKGWTQTHSIYWTVSKISNIYSS